MRHSLCVESSFTEQIVERIDVVLRSMLEASDQLGALSSLIHSASSIFHPPTVVSSYQSILFWLHLRVSLDDEIGAADGRCPAGAPG